MPSNLSYVRALASGIGLASAACSTTPVNTGSARLDDAPMSCTPPIVQYRIASVDPAVAAAAQLDLDGDGTPDDALGAAYDAFAAAAPSFAIAPRFGARLASDVAWMIGVDRCGDDVRFTIDRALPTGELQRDVVARAVGVPIGEAIVARDGELELPLVALADPSGALGAGWTLADGVKIRATVSDAAMSGVFAAAVDVPYARAELASPIATFLAALPSDDPLHVAAQASDGTITADAVAASALFQQLVAGDVVLRAPDGTPRGDATKRISIAFAFSATRSN